VKTGAMVVEIRTYELHPGTRETFDAIFRNEALPLLRQFDVDVVGAAPSLSDDCHYLLVRAFPSLRARVEQNEAFYGSEQWLARLDARVMACIDTYHTVVLEDDGTLRAALRAALASRAADTAWEEAG
jgi:hypothetical protein